MAGFEVETFLSGEEFLRSLLTGQPDCIILDLHMPGVTGFDVQARLAAAHAAVPVVVITGHDSPGARERALAGGAAAYLRKPVSDDALLATIRGCMAAKPGADSAPAET
jgi:FixJ family two-component response regulator